MVRFHLLPPTLQGGITQLVEWLLCKQHVAGSNPTTSTKTQTPYETTALLWFFVYLNHYPLGSV